MQTHGYTTQGKVMLCTTLGKLIKTLTVFLINFDFMDQVVQ